MYVLSLIHIYLNLGLLEISRVLKDYGIFYCTTYGKNHMKEITEIVHNFDSRIQLSNNNLVEHFGLENGKTLLSPYFKQIELKMCIRDRASPPILRLAA